MPIFMGKIRFSRSDALKGFFQRSFVIAASCLFLSSISIFLDGNAFASLLWSQSNGPYGGMGHAIGISKADPGTIYLGTASSGIYLSTDSGESWTIKNTGLIDLATTVNDIAVNPDDASIAYAATGGNGVALTVNSGDLWQPKNNNLPTGYIYAIAIDPLNTRKVYAATYSGVQKSTDEGDSWNSAGLGGIGEVLCLRTVSGGAYSIIYAGTNGGGLWKSTNEAQSWTSILPAKAVFAIGESRSSPESCIYAGVLETTGTWEILKTTNGGTSWTATNLASNITFISVNRSSPEVAYAGTDNAIYKTINGATWVKKSAGIEDNIINKIVIDPANSSKMYACGTYYESPPSPGRAFYASTNEGESWTFKNKGINNVYLGSLLVATSESGTPVIYAGGFPLGVFRSTNEGDSWEEKNNGIPLGIRYVYCLAQDPGDPATILAGASDVNSNNGYVYKSTNEGESWVAKTTVNVGRVYDIEFDKVSPEVVYAGTRLKGTLFRSSDEGETWNPFVVGLPTLPVLNMITSSYEGKSYVHVGIGPPFGNDQSLYFIRDALNPLSSWETTTLAGGNAFAPNYASPESIYITIGNRLFTKTLEARSWSETLYLPEWFSSLAADPGNPSAIYAITGYRGVWKISNFGTSAARDETGLQDTYAYFQYPKPIVINTFSNPRQVFADADARSVWKATEYSQNIPPAPSGLTGSALSPSSIRWSWTDNSLIEQGFRLYSGGTVVATTPANATCEVEGNLSVNTAYIRRVAAFMSGVPDQFSSDSAPAYTLANVPGTPEAKAIGIRYITITWEAKGNPAHTTYEVWGSTPEAGSGLPVYWGSLGTTPTTEYTQSGLTYEAVYWYKARALNMAGITTEFGGENSFKTLPPIPSEDIYPPVITRVKFDGRTYFPKDVIFNTPRISAVITDYASTEPPYIYNVTPEGVDVNSIKVTLGSYVFDVPPSACSAETSTIETFSFVIPGHLGAAQYACTIEARDLAFPWFNRGIWTGQVTVMGDRVSVIGTPLAYPTPFRPLTDKNVTVSYSLTTNSDVNIYMYDISGQMILTRKFKAGRDGGKAGYNQFTWDGVTDFGKVAGNGIYVYKIAAKGRAIGTGKLVVMD